MAELKTIATGVVHPWHHDHFGHMNVRHYAPFFDDAIYLMWTRLGLPYSEMQATHGVHTVSAQVTTSFIKELSAGDLIEIDGWVSRLGTKSVTFKMRMRHADTGETHANMKRWKYSSTRPPAAPRQCQPMCGRRWRRRWWRLKHLRGLKHRQHLDGHRPTILHAKEPLCSEGRRRTHRRKTMRTRPRPTEWAKTCEQNRLSDDRSKNCYPSED